MVNEKEYIGKRDCEACNETFTVDITQWKGTELWTCPKCKNEIEQRLY